MSYRSGSLARAREASIPPRSGAEFRRRRAGRQKVRGFVDTLDLPRRAARDAVSGIQPLGELLRQVAAGDRAAFEALYRAQSPRLYGVAIRITRHSAQAADAVHDAFLQVWRNAARFDVERGNPEAWLLSLARYRALDIARRRGREASDDDLPELADEDPDPLARLQS